uniref:Uncharacterized protein n=1 Tax=Anas platyrhynchos platyrhynchos TaxID=8840 RepID=A0A493TD85_ANAPP
HLRHCGSKMWLEIKIPLSSACCPPCGQHTQQQTGASPVLPTLITQILVLQGCTVPNPSDSKRLRSVGNPIFQPYFSPCDDHKLPTHRPPLPERQEPKLGGNVQLAWWLPGAVPSLLGSPKSSSGQEAASVQGAPQPQKLGAGAS